MIKPHKSIVSFETKVLFMIFGLLLHLVWLLFCLTEKKK